MEHKAFEMDPPHNKEYPHHSKHPFVAGGSGGPGLFDFFSVNFLCSIYKKIYKFW